MPDDLRVWAQRTYPELRRTRTDLTSLLAWWAYVVRFYLIRTWRDLPGPWPVKVALIVICLAIPGPQDEIALIALTAAMRAWRRRREPR